MKPGSLSDDMKSYIPEKENADFVNSYYISVSRKNAQKFATVNFKENVHQAEFYLVLFDLRNKPFAVKKVSVIEAQFLGSRNIPIPNETRGLYFQMISADDVQFDSSLPIYYTIKSIIRASLIHSIFVLLFSLLFAFGIVSMFNHYSNYVFSSTFYILFGEPFIIFLYCIILYAISFATCCFLTWFLNKKYIKSEESL